mgnify:CR=1 FL=1
MRKQLERGAASVAGRGLGKEPRALDRRRRVAALARSGHGGEEFLGIQIVGSLPQRLGGCRGRGAVASPDRRLEAHLLRERREPRPGVILSSRRSTFVSPRRTRRR